MSDATGIQSQPPISHRNSDRRFFVINFVSGFRKNGGAVLCAAI